MSNAYTVQTGDTFEKIARKRYGDEKTSQPYLVGEPGRVRAFSGLGTSLVLPEQPNAPKDVPQQTPSSNENEVAVLIDGQRFRFWENIRITRSIDAMDILEFTAPFEPDQKEFRETFRPFSYRPIVVTVGGGVLFTRHYGGGDAVGRRRTPAR